MKVQMNTGGAEILVLELESLPLVGHYIHHKHRVFIVESVVHEQGKLVYLSLGELI